MNRKFIGILIVLVGLVVIFAIAFFLFFYQQAGIEQPVDQELIEAQESKTTLPQEKTQASITAEKISPTLATPKKEAGEEDLKRIATSFAERFGSYSNQSDYGNIRDLKIFMSLKMQAWADNYIKEAIARRAESYIYYGITTKAIASEAREFDSDLGRAEILVKTQRREATGTMNNASVFYQDILINFVSEKNSWKVDGAFWQNK